MVSGTSVLTDWVELPSQLYEHWLERPEILQRFAVHYRTGQPMPDELMRRVLAARTFNQGFATVEYVASALVDLDFHLQPDAGDISTSTPSRARRSRASACRPRSSCATGRPHFAHVFSGGGYASAYYSYMWSEVLDADAFRGVRGDRRHLRPGDRQGLARPRLRRRRLARSGGALQGVPRPAADARGAAASRRGLAERRPPGEA